MCGLASVLLAPKRRSQAELQEIIDRFTANLLANEQRGRDATGVALIKSDGDFWIHKAAVSASVFVTSAEYHRLLSAVDERTLLLLGHTRLPTQGSPNDNLNNHPVVTGRIVGAHNGHITNDDALFAQHDISRAGEVDSEVIFRLLDELPPPRSSEAYLDDIAGVVRQMRGRLAVIAMDWQHPGHLIVIKNHAKLSMHYDPDLDTLCLSSRYLFLRKAYGYSVAREKLPTQSVILFDAMHLPHKVTRALA
jgi:glucosamine 6-phosphate synthetase-like amidotransferase/phosphosugar isomerase protein